MTINVISDGEFVKHPKDEGVFMKHFFNSADNDRLNNVEIRIEPGSQISPHIHNNSSEFFFVVSGTGEFFIDGRWNAIKKSDALKAPIGVEHGLRNPGSEPLCVFSTFSPSIR